MQGPSERELQLAQEVTKELKELAKEATPSSVVTPTGVREAMGIQYQPQNTSTVIQSDPSFQSSNSQQTNKETQQVTFTSNENVLSNQNTASMSSTNQNIDNMSSTNQTTNISDGNQDSNTDDIDLSEFLQFPSQNTT